MRSKKILEGYYNEKGLWCKKKHKKWDKFDMDFPNYKWAIRRRTFDNKDEEMIIRVNKNSYLKITSLCSLDNQTYLILEDVSKTISWQAKELLIYPDEISERTKRESERKRIERLKDPMRHLNYPYEFDENGEYRNKINNNKENN